MPAEPVGPATCPICESGAAARPYLRHGQLEWLRCSRCGAGWLLPYASELERDAEDFAEPYRHYLATRALFDAVADEKARWLLRRWREGMAIVEIGAGIGALARAVRRFETRARLLLVEPRAPFAAELRGISGASVFTGAPGEATAAALATVRALGQPALFVLDNVLEHVPYPGRLLSSLHAGSPAGSLALVEVPNEQGLGWRAAVQDLLRGERKPPTFPGHINLFTARSLAALGRRISGCDVAIQVNPIRELAQVAYLTQTSDFNWKIRAAVRLLRLLPLDRLLGVAYWLRAEIPLGAAAGAAGLPGDAA
jgi:hypothetical protein